MNSKSFDLAKQFLGKKVKIEIDRMKGEKHPKWGFEYKVNYGFLDGYIAPDGEMLDVYVLGVNEPVKVFEGIVIAIVHRENDDDDKLVVVPEGMDFDEKEIDKEVEFQEKWFDHEIVKEIR